MKVHELIERLLKLPGDLPVLQVTTSVGKTSAVCGETFDVELRRSEDHVISRAYSEYVIIRGAR